MDEIIIKEQGTFLEKYPAAGYQDVKVCMPVTVEAHGDVGRIETQCIGRPEIKTGCHKCEGRCGEKCTFTITQKIRIKVPVMFKVKAEAGDAAVECRDTHGASDCGCAD